MKPAQTCLVFYVFCKEECWNLEQIILSSKKINFMFFQAAANAAAIAADSFDDFESLGGIDPGKFHWFFFNVFYCCYLLKFIACFVINGFLNGLFVSDIFFESIYINLVYYITILSFFKKTLFVQNNLSTHQRSSITKLDYLQS